MSPRCEECEFGEDGILEAVCKKCQVETLRSLGFDASAELLEIDLPKESE